MFYTEYASSKLYDKYELFEKAEEEHLCNKLKLIVTCKVWIYNKFYCQEFIWGAFEDKFQFYNKNYKL